MTNYIDDEQIYFLLEEIPADNGGLTDEESDIDDEPPAEKSSGLDRMFTRHIADMEFVAPPRIVNEENKQTSAEEANNLINQIDLSAASSSTSNQDNLMIQENNFDRIFEEELDQADSASDLVSMLDLVDITSNPESQDEPEKETLEQEKNLEKASKGRPKNPPAKKRSEPTGKKKKIAKRKVDDRQWTKKDKQTTIPAYSGKAPGPVEGIFDTCKTPTDFFIKTIEPIIDNIVYESNLYAVQRGKILGMDRKELFSFIGINFLMGYNVQPSWKDYWSTSPDLGCQLVADTMSRNRFDQILLNLHLNNNLLIPKDNTDKLYKLRPLIDGLNKQFVQIYNVNSQVAVDESTILFKGRSTIKQYNPMKPIKRGYKLWCLGDGKGYIPQFEIYQGKGGIMPDDDLRNFGSTEQVVLRLTKPFWNTNIQVYFDNFYSSLPLLEKLKVENVLACGTIRSDRVGVPSFPQSKMSRGDSDYRISNLDISIYKWMDNRPVMFGSNYHGSEMTSVTRKNSKGEKMEVSCPQVVKDYNMHMGGVDLADQLRQYYCVNRRSKKWWHRLFWGLMDFAFVNSFVIYNCLNPKMKVLEFRRSVAQGLMAKKQKCQSRKRKSIDEQGGQPKRGKNSKYSVPNDVRLGNRGVHYVIFSEKRGRCEECSANKIESRPYSVCKMCKVYLCQNEKKNCFQVYHEFD